MFSHVLGWDRGKNDQSSKSQTHPSDSDSEDDDFFAKRNRQYQNQFGPMEDPNESYGQFKNEIPNKSSSNQEDSSF